MARGLASLAVLTLLAVTLHSLVFSGANFSGDDSTSASFTAGSVSLDNPAENDFILRAEPIRAGGTKQTTLTIGGGPDVPASYTLVLKSLTDSQTTPTLGSVLQLQIDDVTVGMNVYQGPAAGFVSADLGVLGDGDTKNLQFTLTYPAAQADRALMGASMEMRLEFIGVSL